MATHSRTNPLGPTRLALLVFGLALSSVPTTRAAELWGPDHPLRRIKAETLVYRVRAWAGTRVLAIPLGTATFTLSRDTVGGERQLVLRADANGGVPGIYPFVATITSRLRDADFLMRHAEHVRTKKTYRRRVLRFHDGGAHYLKHRHCSAPTLCHNPRHLLAGRGGKRIHCTGCDDPKHFVWSMRERHRYTGRFYDLIGALYLARGFPIAVGGPTHSIRVVQNHFLWELTLHPVKEETVTVPAGTIRCLRIALTNTPLNDQAKRRAGTFEGPFGLHGGIRLYVDKDTKQPVLIRGKVKLGSTFDVEVVLTQRTVERTAAP